MSTLADRIKIARMTSSTSEDDEGPDISFSIQFILNCGGEIAGSCHGGENLSTCYEIPDVHAINLSLRTQFVPYWYCLSSTTGSASGAFEFIKNVGYVPYETCMPYLACSSESTEGFCPHVSTECDPSNICRTCSNPWKGGTCNEVRLALFITLEYQCTFKCLLLSANRGLSRSLLD